MTKKNLVYLSIPLIAFLGVVVSNVDDTPKPEKININDYTLLVRQYNDNIKIIKDDCGSYDLCVMVNDKPILKFRNGVSINDIINSLE